MQSGEDRLIARFFQPLATAVGALGLSDDAAFLTPPPGYDIVLQTDALVAGVHFFPDDAPGLIARKALRVNLSDLAAKGAKPAGFLLALAIPAECNDGWLADFSAGLKQDAEAFACPLYGGDTVRMPGPASISIFAVGTLPTGSMVRRHGAKPGEAIVVTGTIGDAALGLRLRREPGLAKDWGLGEAEREHLLGRYLLPQPRVVLAEAVRRHASAAMDISDGLAGDLAKLCRVSGVTARIDADAVPLSEAARKALRAEPAMREAALTGGDDYEIVCAMPETAVAAFAQAAGAAGIAVARIGQVEAGEGEPRFVAGGRVLQFERPSFTHF